MASKYAQRLSPFLTYHPAPCQVGPRKPTVLFFPWLGATTRGMQKYIDLYHDTGMDVVLVDNNKVIYFLWPKSLNKVTASVLPELQRISTGDRQFVVHATSVGAYAYTVLHMHLMQSPEFRNLNEKIVGHVFDSVVVGGLGRMATGVAKTTTGNQILQQLITKTCLLYFSALKSHTADVYDKAVNYFFNELGVSPSLFFFCGNDHLADTEVMRNVLRVWRKRGIFVYDQYWPISVHAGHLREHPDDYTKIFTLYLDEVFKRSVSVDQKPSSKL